MLTQMYQLQFQTSTEQMLLALLQEQFLTDFHHKQKKANGMSSFECPLATCHFQLDQSSLIRLAVEFNTTPAVISLAIFGIILHRHTPESDSISVVVGQRQLTIPIRDCNFSTIVTYCQSHGGDDIIRFMSSTSSMIQSSTVAGRPLVLYIDAKCSNGAMARLNCQLVYFATYLDDKTAQNMCETFRSLLMYLDTFSTTVDPSYCELIGTSLVYPDAMIDYFDSSAMIASSHNTIFTHFKAMASRYPDRICLQLSEICSLTYEQCLKLVDHLSFIFQHQLGVTKSSVIGLWMDSSFEYVIALLATLKLSAVFVPLDKKHPCERLEYIEKQSNINIILTNNGSIPSNEGDPSFSAPKIQLKITNDGKLNLEYPYVNSGSSESSNTSHSEGGYVIFTSGSSGKPKGVLIDESGVLNMALAQIRIFDIKPSDVVAQFASICFDASLSEIFMALLAGAKLIIFRSPEERTGSRLVDTLNTLSITVITLPPSLLSGIDPEKIPSICTVISAGEPCPTVLACKWANSYRRFFNAYGPSEASVCSTIYEYDSSTAAELAKYETLPIGAAIDNLRTRVVDSQFNDVPTGASGELLVSGIGVSRKGYIGTSNEKNNIAFVTCNGERWYRTGDLVTSMESDHQMFIYLGRMDTQVKVRGCRIELTEIEAAILTCPGVTHCVVVVHRCDKCDDDQGLLAAYVDGTAMVDSIQEHITHKLPTYMLPTYMIVHSSLLLPTNLSGKIDRKLLALDSNVHHQHTIATPLTSLEQQMYSLWCQVLYKQYDKDADVDPENLTFAKFGGNSLSVALLHALLLEQYSFKTRIYAHMSLKQMADLLAQQNNIVDNNSYEAIMNDLNNDDIDTIEIVNRSRSHVLDGTSSILLTGATGFLGCFLLNELLTTTSMTVLVLVRANSQDEGKKRLYSTLMKYKLFNETIQQAFEDNEQRRVEIVLCKNLADYDDSFAGLELDTRWNNIDGILHCAADTNFNLIYEKLRQVNVQLTKYLLQQSIRYTIPFYHISSLSIFLFSQDDPTLEAPYIGETDQPQLRSMIGGYSQSKYVSDMIVLKALRRGLPGAIFRPGRVTGSSITGMGSMEDFFILMLRGCQELGTYPKLTFPFDVTPVDLVSKAIVRVITKPPSQYNSTPLIVHLVNTETVPFDEQFKLLNQFNHDKNPMKEVPFNEWCQQLIHRVSSEQQQKSNTFNPLLPLIPFLRSSFWQHVHQWPIFTRTNETDAVMDMCPKTLFELYFRVWRDDGLLN